MGPAAADAMCNAVCALRRCDKAKWNDNAESGVILWWWWWVMCCGMGKGTRRWFWGALANCVAVISCGVSVRNPRRKARYRGLVSARCVKQSRRVARAFQPGL